jgi:glycosyltransferase involved in cell wall biosynthesis
LTTPVRVIHVLRGAQGGSFRHLCDLTRGQAERGHDVGIVSSAGVGGAATDAALASLEPLCSLGIHRFPMERAPGVSDVRAVRGIERVCRQVRPHVVHGHGAKGAAYGRLVASRVGAKAIYTPHGGALHYSWSSPSGFVYLGLERLLKARTDGLIFASDYARGTYERKLGSTPCPWRVVHNGLHEHEFYPVERGSAQYDFVFVGEIRLLKGIEVLVDAAAEVRRRGGDLSVLVVGAGPDEARVRARIDESGLADIVTLSPPIYPAREAFAMARCVVIPSLAESLPYIVLEVLASRVPLLATRVGGIPEIVGPHADGLLPPGDVEALADRLSGFLSDPDPAEDVASVLHEHVSRHVRVPQMVDATLGLYEEVLGARASAVATTRR